MKILWLSGYSPWPANHGGKIRLYNLVKQLLARGHTIELWCICNEAVQWSESPAPPGLSLRRFQAKNRETPTEKFAAIMSPLPEPAWSVTTAEVKAELALQDSRELDMVILEQAILGWPDRVLPKTIPYVLDAQNVEWWLAYQIARRQPRLARRVRFSLDAMKFRRLEAKMLRAAAAVIAMSSIDATRLGEVATTRLMAIRPSGVDLDYFRWVDHSELRQNRLLMTGTLGYAPNLDACQWMRAEIMPAIRARVPSATVDLVGGAADEASALHAPDEGVNVVGPVPDVRAYMESADVFVVPLRMGSGTRLKIVEALAAGLPVVSTAIAAEGLGLPEEVILIGNTVHEIAAHVHTLLVDATLRSRMSRAGRRYAEEHFSWREIAEDMERTLVQVVASRNVRPRAG